MHVPDGFFDTTTSVGAGAVTAGVIASCVKRATVELSDRLAPLCGLVAAFVFAAQMVNFPIAAGTSGHLLGGTLAAVLVGPWAGTLCVTIVVFVQALLFADGGLTAFGINAVLIAITPAFVGYGVFLLARWILPTSRTSVATAAGIGALISVPVSAAVFALLYAVGGAVDISLSSLVAAMVGVHILIGIGEALITTAVVSAVITSRPDLVHGAGSWLTGDAAQTDAAAVSTT